MNPDSTIDSKSKSRDKSVIAYNKALFSFRLLLKV